MATPPCDTLPEWMTTLRDEELDADAVGDDSVSQARFLQKMLLRYLDIRAKMENERADLMSLNGYVAERLEQLRLAEERVRAAEDAWGGRAVEGH